MDEILS